MDGRRRGADRRRGSRPRGDLPRPSADPNRRVAHLSFPRAPGAAPGRRPRHGPDGGQGATAARASPRHRLRSAALPGRSGGGGEAPCPAFAAGELQLPRPVGPSSARGGALRPGTGGRRLGPPSACAAHPPPGSQQPHRLGRAADRNHLRHRDPPSGDDRAPGPTLRRALERPGGPLPFGRRGPLSLLPIFRSSSSTSRRWTRSWPRFGAKRKTGTR